MVSGFLNTLAVVSNTTSCSCLRATSFVPATLSLLLSASPSTVILPLFESPMLRIEAVNRASSASVRCIFVMAGVYAGDFVPSKMVLDGVYALAVIVLGPRPPSVVTDEVS